MCGIAGIIGFADQPVEEGALQAACAAMRHRGPDDSGVWLGRAGGRPAGLAAVRLAVQDPTPAGHQPMTRDDGRYVLVFNGEVYNFPQLRRELAQFGERFDSRCDTEVVLAACMRWGPDALKRFNGMWALAFLDTQTGSGFLARDRFGIKPLLYTPGAGRCCFASEMRTLRAFVDGSAKIDDEALLHYLRLGYIAHPQTIYADVRRLPPGCWLPFSRDGIGEAKRYYEVPPPGAADEAGDYVAVCARTRDLIFRATADRRLADVPVGAFLSGGLDSSIVVAHLASCSTSPVKTFSIGYAEHGVYDETRYARLVADRFGTDHHEIKLTYDDVLAVLLPMIDHLGEPFADSSILPTALVSEFARRNVTVALSGDGGDELFGGYWRYLAHDAMNTYARLPGWLRAGLIEPILARAPSSKATAWRNRLRQFRKLLRAPVNDAWQRHLAWSEILSPEARSILSPTARQMLAANDPVLDRSTGPADGDAINRILAFDLHYGLPGDMLHKVDLASMYHSLEVRVPLLDVGVVDAVAPLPSRFKVHRGRGKRLLIDAHRSMLPEAILHRPKQGFEVPIGEFLRGPLRGLFRDTVTRRTVEPFGLIDFDAVQRIYAEHCDQRGEHADLLYALMVLCRWAEQTRAV